MQVHLQAADVHGPDAAGLEVLHGGDRLGFRVVEVADPFGVDRPRPWIDRTADRVPASTLDHGDRVQQAVGHMGRALRLEDGGAAHRGRGRDACSRHGTRLRQIWPQAERDGTENGREDGTVGHAATV